MESIAIRNPNSVMLFQTFYRKCLKHNIIIPGQEKSRKTRLRVLAVESNSLHTLFGCKEYIVGWDIPATVGHNNTKRFFYSFVLIFLILIILSATQSQN